MFYILIASDYVLKRSFLLHSFLWEKMIWLQIDQSHVQFTTSSSAYIVFLWALPIWTWYHTGGLKPEKADTQTKKYTFQLEINSLRLFYEPGMENCALNACNLQWKQFLWHFYLKVLLHYFYCILGLVMKEFTQWNSN